MSDNPSGSNNGIVEDIAETIGDYWDDWFGGNGNGNGQPSSGQQVRSTDGIGCAVVVPAQMKARVSCPPGYVSVVDPNSPNGQGKVCMLKKVAVSTGRWKAARKPPIKASDWRCLMKADSVVRKLDTVVKKSNKITGKARLTRSRSKSRC